MPQSCLSNYLSRPAGRIHVRLLLEFEIYWVYFEWAMMVDPQIKFYHNRTVPDDFFATEVYYWVDDVNRLYDAGTRRMGAFFTYGFYKESYQRIERLYESVRGTLQEWRRKRHEYDQTHISMRDLNVVSLFKLVQLCLAASSALYFAEVITAYMRLYH